MSVLQAQPALGNLTRVSKNLDEIDLKILAEIQADGRITNVELAKRVGISPPPCLRRVRTLEEEGYILGYRGLLDPRRLGFDVTVFASVHLSSQADADLRAFEEFVRAEPLVRECWMLSGEVDFILKCVAPDMATFQEFVTHLTAAPHVRNVRTSLVLHNSKYEAAVPLDMKDGLTSSPSFRRDALPNLRCAICASGKPRRFRFEARRAHRAMTSSHSDDASRLQMRSGHYFFFIDRIHAQRAAAGAGEIEAGEAEQDRCVAAVESGMNTGAAGFLNMCPMK